MATMTFQVNDATNGGNVATWITVTEQADGTLLFTVNQSGNYIGDLRGLFFDMADESIINSLAVVPASDGFTNLKTGNDSVKDLGGGANMNGLLGGTGGTDTAGYDVGIEIGTSGIGKDDYRSFSFVLDSSLRDLTLADLSNVNFGVRLTSVGEVGGLRSDSSKLLEVTSTAINAGSDSAIADENASISGNVLSNDVAGLPATDTVSVTSWTGGALGQNITLENGAGATLTLNSDGSYVVDASAADALSAGETLDFHFEYTAKAVNEATSWSSDTASLNVTIVGANDGPVAVNDSPSAPVAEDGLVSGNVLANDSDIDRLDVISVVGVNDSLIGSDGSTTIALTSGAKVTISSDGTYTYDTNGAFDTLMSGETAFDTFEYTISDNHGATATATVTIQIDGAGSPGGDGENPGGGGGNPVLPGLGLSHGYWKTHDGNPNADDWNIDHDTSFEEFFGIDAGSWKIGSGPGQVTMNDVMFDEALELQGGNKYALAREAVTAVLNAVDEKNGTVYDFAYSVEEVKTMVHDALASNDQALIESTKDLLEASHD